MTKEEKKNLYDMGAKKAIKKLEALPAEQMDYDLIGILARAYNNNDEEQKAKDCAMQLALEQYGFCPDVVDQGVPDGTVGMLASQLS